MPHSALAAVLRHLRRAAHPPGADAPSDGQLLERFACRRDEAAFEALLERHGRMVWNVCWRVLANSSDAADAFQATFLVLVRKAGSIAKRDSVASWLYGVAHRVALDARAGAARRRAHEQRAGARAEEGLPVSAEVAELRQVLDEELARLPEKYRAPLVLCYLEGKTNDEAADQLGWTRGTIAGRLSRARDLLRGRLARRGLSLAPAVLASALAQEAAPAAVPAGLAGLTLKAALGYATATAGASAPAVALAEGALHTMFVSRLKITTFLLAALALAATGAGWLLHQALARPPRPAPEPPPSVSKPLVLAKDPAQARADRPALVTGNTAFAWDLYARLRRRDGNVVCSPYSISTALAMTYAGARGKTAEQMAEVLHFTLPQERLHPAAGALVRDLSGEAKGKKRNYQLRVANALWGQKDYGFLNDFLALTRESYGAGLTEVDFIKGPEEARKTINAWVEKQTEDKIKELVRKEHITADTRLVLTNAIYFKADWQTKFFKMATRDEPFHLTAKHQVKVPTMYRANRFAHFDGGTFQMLELPFAGKELSMLVLLPKKVDGLPELEKSLTADKLAAWHGKLRQAEVCVYLPRFKVTGAFELKKELVAMGMPLPFERGADFTGMAGSGKALLISEVVHKTYLDVNEEGVEAAAATAVPLPKGDVTREPVIFRADHPFVFVVRDNRSGSVLFAGRVADPTK
jgi:serpin B